MKFFLFSFVGLLGFLRYGLLVFKFLKELRARFFNTLMISLKLVPPSQIIVSLVFGCNQPLLQAIHYLFVSFLRLIATDKSLS